MEVGEERILRSRKGSKVGKMYGSRVGRKGPGKGQRK